VVKNRLGSMSGKGRVAIGLRKASVKGRIVILPRRRQDVTRDLTSLSRVTRSTMLLLLTLMRRSTMRRWKRLVQQTGRVGGCECVRCARTSVSRWRLRGHGKGPLRRAVEHVLHTRVMLDSVQVTRRGIGFSHTVWGHSRWVPGRGFPVAAGVRTGAGSTIALRLRRHSLRLLIQPISRISKALILRSRLLTLLGRLLLLRTALFILSYLSSLLLISLWVLTFVRVQDSGRKVAHRLDRDRRVHHPPLDLLEGL
jgi:hypothetical protein